MNVYPKIASGSCRRCGLVARHLSLLLSGKLFSWWFFGSQELKGLGLSFTEGLSGPLLFHGDTTFLSLEEVAATKNNKTNMEHSKSGNDLKAQSATGVQSLFYSNCQSPCAPPSISSPCSWCAWCPFKCWPCTIQQLQGLRLECWTYWLYFQIMGQLGGKGTVQQRELGLSCDTQEIFFGTYILYVWF